MPPTNQRQTKGLAMYIDNPQPSYKPGDTICGRVFRQVPVLVGAEDVKVTIELSGRVEAKLTLWSDHTRESRRSYRSLVHLFSGKDTLQTLHHGPLHIPRTVSGLAHDELGPQGYEEGIGRSWPFTVTIPAQTSSVSWENEGTNIPFPQHSFIPTDEDGHGAMHQLPSSLALGPLECEPGGFFIGGVSYFLEAHLRSVHANRNPCVEVPINIQNHQIPAGYSPDIEPQMLESTLVYGKHFWPKGNEIRFEIETPSTYMLDQRGPLLFAIRAMWPSPPSMGKGEQPRKEPIIVVKAFTINLVKIIDVGVSQGEWGFRVPSHHETYPIHKTTRSGEQDSNQIRIPFGPGKKSLDLDQILGVQIGSGTTNLEGSPRVPPLLPSFRTFNIKRSYKLVWEVVMDIAGENLGLEGQLDIVLL